MTDQPKLRLLTGGDLQVGDDTDLAAARPRALFVLLALNAGKALSRDRLCDFLWPYTDQSTARQRLRMALLNMKRGLSGDLCARLRTSAESIALDIDPSEIDALRFMALADQATPDTQAEAVALYGGDLLGQMPPISDVFDRMIEEKRNAYRGTLLYLLHDMMRAQTEAGDRSGFERTFRRALEVDGANDETATLAMAAAAADRQVIRVREIYDAYAAEVEKSFGSDPPNSMRAARDTSLAEAERPEAGTIRPERSDVPSGGFAELRAKPRVALLRSGRRIRVATVAVAILCIMLVVAGGFLWSRAVRLDAREGQVFLFRPVNSIAEDCEPNGEVDLFEQALLDALQRFEGSSTVLGSVRSRLIGTGPAIFEVELSVTCLNGGTRATITVVNTESRGVAWVGRYNADPTTMRELGERIFGELSGTFRER
jgi:DNA-binding SARP family transcriptional activator